MASHERTTTLTGIRAYGHLHGSRGQQADDSDASASIKSSGTSLRSLRLRRSFFGRSSSDAGFARRKGNEKCEAEKAQERSAAAHEAYELLGLNEQPRRRPESRQKTEPLQSIRNSIIGGRKGRERGDSNASKSSSQNSDVTNAAPSWSREHFRSEDDYYHYWRKQSISTPFNFEHVTHSTRAQMPRLETVEEKDLAGEFWSVSAYERPKRHLNGIQAEDLPRRNGNLRVNTNLLSPDSALDAPIPVLADSPGPQLATPVLLSPIGSISNETSFNESTETRFDPDDGIRTLQPAKHVMRYPKRYSSLPALSEEYGRNDSLLGAAETFYESSTSSDETEVQRTPSSASRPPTARSIDPHKQPPPPPIAEEITQADIAYRSRQPLPPLPAPKQAANAARKPPKGALKLKTRMSVSTPQLVTPVDNPVSPLSKQSSVSSRSARVSPIVTSASETRRSAVFSDMTWEDDVDLAYEQEAEATCNFNWDTASRSREGSTQSDSISQLSSSIYHAHSPTITISSVDDSLKHQSSADTVAERSRRGAPKHRRGSSVGHRGFLAARKSNHELSSAKNNPAPSPITVSANSTQVSVLSPVFSVAGDEETPKTPYTPGTLQFAALDAVRAEDLSDPESSTNSDSLKHRKSSSYGSYESTARPRPARSPNREKNRWSVVSVTSVPGLMRSRSRESRSSLKNMISAPLESLPQSPKQENEQHRESSIIPRTLQTEPQRSSFIMRRPGTQGDRAILQAAGRAVQRGRPTTPSRFSQLLQAPEQHFDARQAQPEGDGPEWI